MNDDQKDLTAESIIPRKDDEATTVGSIFFDLTKPICLCGGKLHLERSKWRCIRCGLYPESCCDGGKR